MTTPTTFVWTSPHASSVQVAGSWDGFTAKTNLTRQSDGTFEATLSLSENSKMFCKFIVDGQWLTKPDLPTQDDGHGNLNNVIHVGPAPAKPAASAPAAAAPAPAKLPVPPPSPAPFPNSVPTTPVVPASSSKDEATSDPFESARFNTGPRLSISGASAGGIAGASTGVIGIAASFVNGGAKATDAEGKAVLADSTGRKDPYTAAAEETVASVLGTDALRSKAPAAVDSKAPVAAESSSVSADASGAATPLASAGQGAPAPVTKLNGTPNYEQLAALALKEDKSGADAGAVAVAASATAATGATAAGLTTVATDAEQKLSTVSATSAAPVPAESKSKESSKTKESSTSKSKSVEANATKAKASVPKVLPPGSLIAPDQQSKDAPLPPASTSPRTSSKATFPASAPAAAPGVVEASTQSVEPTRGSVGQNSAGPGGAAPPNGGQATPPSQSSTLTPSQSGTLKSQKGGSRFSTLGRRKSAANGLDETFTNGTQQPASPGKNAQQQQRQQAPTTPSKSSAAAKAPVTPVSDRKRKQSIFGKIKEKLGSPSPSKQ